MQHCPVDAPLIKVHLDQAVFSGKPTDSLGYRELRQIADIRNLPERLLALIDWFVEFTYDRNFNETGINLVMRLMAEKQGSCRHRAFLFQMLCLYWGIEARIAESVSHSFVEVRCREGWRHVDLSGAGKSTTQYSPEPEWDLLYQSAPVQPVKSPCEQDSTGNTSGWERIVSLAVSLHRQYQCASYKLPQKASDILQAAVLEEFQKNFLPIPLGRGG